MDFVSLIVSLVSGAVGGNAAGAVMKDKSLGTVGNSIAGVLGGGLGGAILQMLGVVTQGGAMDLTSIVESVAGGGVGGALLLAVVALVKNAMGQAGPKAH